MYIYICVTRWLYFLSLVASCCLFSPLGFSIEVYISVQKNKVLVTTFWTPCSRYCFDSKLFFFLSFIYFFIQYSTSSVLIMSLSLTLLYSLTRTQGVVLISSIYSSNFFFPTSKQKLPHVQQLTTLVCKTPPTSASC